MESNTITVSDNIPAISDDQIIQMAENAEKRIDAIKKIKEISLKVTNPNDWIDQKGKPYLQSSGSSKVARVFGVSWRIDEPVKETFEDGHFQYTVKGEFSLAGATIETMGVRGSKDGFFSIRYKWDEKAKKKLPYDVPPNEIDAGDVKKSAITNLLGIGVTTILGIRNMTWGEIAETLGFGKDDVTNIQYDGKGKGNKKPSLKPPQKSHQDSKTVPPVKDNGKEDTGEGEGKTWPNKAAFIADINSYEHEDILGASKYADILSLHEIDPGEIHRLNKDQGLALWQDLAKAKKEKDYYRE